MLYATPALLEERGLTKADQDPDRLLVAPPKAMLKQVSELAGKSWLAWLGLGSIYLITD